MLAATNYTREALSLGCVILSTVVIRAILCVLVRYVSDHFFQTLSKSYRRYYFACLFVCWSAGDTDERVGTDIA